MLKMMAGKKRVVLDLNTKIKVIEASEKTQVYEILNKKIGIKRRVVKWTWSNETTAKSDWK